MKYHILYRGPLSSCNYGCAYCPFAKHAESRAELDADRRAAERFVTWVGTQSGCRFGVLFTPWGEALIRPWYQQALIALTHMPNIDRAAIQTNLSCPTGWVRACRLDRLALWTTFHPTEVKRPTFVAKVRSLHDRGVRLSVGVVGLREHFEEIERLRAELPAELYVWVNAYKRVPRYYEPADLRRLEAIDPLFPINNRHHESLGQPCGAGHTSFAVDGEGTMRRCHFVGVPIGNIYTPTWQDALMPRRCPNAVCSCHIGYVHLHSLRQDLVYGDGLLERIPLHFAESSPDAGGIPARSSD
jgi:hypothetical protein